MTFNAMTARVADLNLLHPLARHDMVRLVEAVRSHRLPFDVFETYRSPQRQQTLVNKVPKVTVAGPFQSAHQYGMAMDLVGFRDGQWTWAEDLPWDDLKPLAAQFGLEIPIPWDKGHVIHPQWYLVRDLMDGGYH